MNPFGRVPMCGGISNYNNTTPAPGPNNMMAIIRQRITLRGFIVSDHGDRRSPFQADMSRWLKEGAVRDHATISNGIDNSVGAFLGLLRGENTGKMLVKLS
jgi:NADPH-dependent curcumin reductase CurA